MNLKNILISTGVWERLPPDVQARVESGKLKTLSDQGGAVEENTSASRSSHAMLGMILSGRKLASRALKIKAESGNISLPPLNLPDRSELIKKLKERIKTRVDSRQRRKYYGTITFLKNHDAPASLLAGAHITISANLEEGLDLLEDLRENYKKLQKMGADMEQVGAMILGVASREPEIVASALRTVSTIATSKYGISTDERKKLYRDVMTVAPTLNRFFPVFSLEFFDINDEHPHLGYYYRKLIGIMAAVVRVQGDNAPAVLRSMLPDIRKYFIKLGAARHVKNQKHYVSLARYFPFACRNHAVLSELIRQFTRWGGAKVGDEGRRGIMEFMGLASHDPSSAEDPTVDNLLELWSSMEKDRAVGMKRVVDFAQIWSSFVPARSVARFVSHPRIGLAVADGEGARRNHYDLELISFLTAPNTRRLFAAYLDSYSGFENKLDLDDVVRLFDYISLEEIYTNVNPVTDAIDWDEFKEGDVKQHGSEQIERVAQRLREEAAVETVPKKDIKTFNTDLLALKAEWNEPRRYYPPRLIGRTIAALTRMHEENMPPDRRLELFNNLLKGLSHMSYPGMENRTITRTALALAVIASTGTPGMMKSDLGSLVSVDLASLRKTEELWRLHAILIIVDGLVRTKHPQTGAIVEQVLADLMKPLSRRRSRIPVADALFITRDFITSVDLDKIPLTPGAQRLLRLARARMEASKTGVLTDEEMKTIEAVNNAFYQAADDPDPLEVRIRGGRAELGPAPVKNDEADGVAASQAESLALVVGGRSKDLATRGLVADPRTGLAMVRLGDGTGIPLWRALAPIHADDHRDVRRDWHARQNGSHTAAQDELKKLEREWQKSKGKALVPQARDKALAASRLEKLSELDSTQMMLGKAAGGDVKEKMLNALKRMVSLSRGFKMLELAVQAKFPGTTIDSVADAAHLLPNITAVEIAFLSLSDRVPPLILDREGLTMIYGVTTAGIEWANDTYNPEINRQGLEPNDAYIFMGMTGKRGATNFSHFRPPVRDSLFTLLRSGLKDRYFFDQLWTWNASAAVMGLNMLKKTSDPRRLLNKEVIDLDRHRSLAVPDIAKLIGLLDHIPKHLVQAEAARLYFKPFAGGILFADHDGQPVEYVAYHPYLQSHAFQNIYYEVENSASDSNPLMRQLLGGDMLSTFYDAALDQTEGVLSPLEELAESLISKYGIGIPLPLRMERAVYEPTLGMPADSISIKMDREELEALDGSFQRLPPHVLERALRGKNGLGGVVRIHKSIAPSPNAISMSVEKDIFGQYEPQERTLTVYHLQEQPYRTLSDVEKQMWRYMVVHELGESVYSSLPMKDRVAFVSNYPWRSELAPPGYRIDITPTVLSSSFSRVVPDIADKEISQHFLTTYSTHEPNDLFAEAFAAYICHGPEFRRKAENSPLLKKLYEWLSKNIFTDVNGMQYEIAVESEFSLDDINAEVTRWRAERHKRAQDFEDELIRQKQQAHEDGTISDVVESVEERFDRAHKVDEIRYRKEVGAEGFTHAYFTIAAGDEEARTARRFGRLLGQDASASDIEVVEKMARVLSDVFPLENETELDLDDTHNWEIQYDSDGDAYETEIITASEAIGGSAEYIASYLWKMMRDPDVRLGNLVDYLEREARGFEHERGESLDIDIDEDFALGLVHTAARSMVQGNEFHERISLILSEYILPGQYNFETVLELFRIAMSEKFSTLEAVTAIYRYLMNTSLPLSRDDCAALSEDLLNRELVRFTDLGDLPLARIILMLDEGEETFHQIARALDIGAGKVDAFAEVFLQSEQYEKFHAQSQVDELLGELSISRNAHLVMQEVHIQRFSEEEPRIAEGLANIEKAIAMLEKDGAGALDGVREIIKQTEHSEYLMNVGADLVNGKKGEGSGGGTPSTPVTPSSFSPVTPVTPPSITSLQSFIIGSSGDVAGRDLTGFIGSVHSLHAVNYYTTQMDMVQPSSTFALSGVTYMSMAPRMTAMTTQFMLRPIMRI